MKKILYIKAQGLGDMIGGIPFLVQQKELGNEVSQTFYDMNHFNYNLSKHTKDVQEYYKKMPMYTGRHHILRKLKDQGLIKEIVIVPYGYLNLFWFIIKNFKKYDEAVIPIKTKTAKLLGRLLAKKSRIIFNHVNDTSKYRILANGENGPICPALHTYSNHFSIPQEYMDIPKKFITIFPSIYERSLEMKDWINIIDYCKKQGYAVLVLGGDREQWFINQLKQHDAYDKIIDYMSKTSLGQMVYILSHARVCISGNGGPMWVANLVNKNTINIHTVSSYLMEPPIDNISSYNVRPYDYRKCQPCESGSFPYEGRVKSCVFYDTDKEGECRRIKMLITVMFCVKKILLSSN